MTNFHFSRLAAIISALLLPVSAFAATYTYTITDSTTDLWTDGTNWDATPVSDADTNLVFGPSGAFDPSDVTNTNTNDFVTPFQLNTLTLQGTGPEFLTVATTIAGGSLEFVNSSTNVGPQINLTASHDVGAVFYAVNSNLSLTNTLTITGDGTAGFSFGGAISGAGDLIKSGASAVTLTGTNTYGATTVNAGILAIDHDGVDTFGTLGSGATTINGDSGTGAGTLQFQTGSSADSGTLTINGGAIDGGSGGGLEFSSAATAGSSTITANGGTVSGAFGSSVVFLGGSTAGAATLTLNGGTDGGYAAAIGFYEDSLGGTAAIELNGSSTYLDITFHNGSLTIGSLAGSGNVFLGANNLTIGSNDADTTFSGVLQDGGPGGGVLGSLTKTGLGTLTLSGENTYTGDTAIESGTLLVTGTLGGGNYLGAIANDGVLNISSSSDQILAGVISGSGSLIKGSSGKLTLTADNTYGGGTTISGGTLQLGDGGTTGSVAGDITDNGSLVFDHSNAFEYAGVISGSGSVTQSADSTLTLSGANTYTGATTVSAGTLALSDNDRLSASTTISITGGATLDLGGHSQTVAGLGSAGNGLAGTITAGTITTAGDAYLSSGTFSNTLAGAGRLYIGGSSSAVNLNGTNDATTPGHDQVIIGGSTTGAAGLVKLGNANALAAATENVHLWAGVLNLNGLANVRAHSIVVENGDTSAIINGTTASAASFAGGVTLVNGMTQIGGLGDISLSGVLSGNGGVTKTSSGTVTLSAFNNTYTGDTEILAGSLVISGTLASGDYHGAIANSGALTFSAPAADQTLAGVISGTGSLTKSGTGTLTLSATNTYTGATTIGAGTLEVTGSLGAGTYSGAIANSGTLVIASSANQTLSGVISGTGSLTKSGTGTLTLTATNTYAGGTVLNGGILGLGADNALGTGLLTINGGNIRAVGNERTLTNDITINGDFTLGRLTNLSGAIALTNDITITSGNPDSVEPVSSTLSGVISGAHSLTFTDGTNPVGTIVLAGNNTYTGDTTVSSGSLLVTGTLGSGNYLGAISNSGSLTFSLSAAQTFAGAISNSGDLTFSSSAGLTLSGVISGNGSLTKNGSGSLTLSGENTYTGGTTISAGLVTFSSLDSFGTGNISLNGGGLKWAAGNTADISSRLNPIPISISHGTIQGTILDTNGNNVSFASALSFADGAALIKTGAGALTLSGATGAGLEFDVAEGTLALGTGAYQGSLYVGFSNYSQDLGNSPSAVILSGADTSFSSSDTMISSGNEFSASLTISDGASFSTPGYVYLGFGASAESTLNLTVTGSGSTYTGTSDLLIGTYGLGRSTFIVSDGASATTQNTILGDASAGENILTVSGTGSTFTTTGNLYIGAYSVSGQLITDSAAMTVSGGALASAGTTVIGRFGAISANSLTLTGTGSTFTTGSLTLAAGAADNGTLNLGSAAADAATAAGVLNTATVTGGAGAAVLQFNTTGTDLAPTYFTRDGTNTGTGVNTTGGLSIVNTAGTTVLSGTGTQTGATIVNGGTLVAPQLANGGSSSSIGQSSSAATNLVLNGGALRYTGAAQSTDRLFQIGGTTAGGTGTLDASGTGAVNFTNTGSVAYGTANQTRTLGLTGTNTGANTLAAVIANNGTGAVSVAKSGPGTWALTGTNTYTGGTTITGGLVSFTTGANLGTGNITLDGGGLLWPTRTLIDISSRLNAIGAGGATFAFDGYNNFATFASALTGSGGITKAGTGTLYLAAANTYLGPTTIRDGEVGVLNNGVTTFGTLGSGLTTVGEGRYAGLQFYDAASAGNGTFIANVGAFISFNGTSTASNGTFTVAGGTVSDEYGAGLTFQQQATAGSATITLNGGTASGALGGDLQIVDNADLGSATLIVNGGTNGGLGAGITFYNDATGGTATVKLYGNGFLDLTNSFHNSGDASPVLANNVSIGSLEGDGQVLLGGGLTVGTNNASTVFSGVIQDGASFFIYTRDYSLTKAGTGTLTLSGTNTYSGGTTINGGKLIVDGSIAGTTTINNTGTLGGHGTVGAVTINSGGTISPGNSPGTLTTSDETWAGGGAYVWEINDATGTKGATPGYDWLNIGGTLNIAATGVDAANKFTIYVTSLNGSNIGGNPALNFNSSLDQSWVIATTTGAITGYSDGKFAIDTSAFFNTTGPNSSWHLSVVPNGGGNDLLLTYTAVPEPAAWGAVLGLGLLALAATRKHRRSC